jgi:hypothetical protein
MTVVAEYGYVRLVERVARSHILHLPSDADLQLFYQIVFRASREVLWPSAR